MCSNDVISIFARQKYLFLETESFYLLKIFLRFWPFEPHFFNKLFSYKEATPFRHKLYISHMQATPLRNKIRYIVGYERVE